MSQTPYEEAEHLDVTDKLRLVHSDICGPLPPSKEGCKYFLTLTDDATHYRWIHFLKQVLRWVHSSLVEKVAPRPREGQNLKRIRSGDSA